MKNNAPAAAPAHHGHAPNVRAYIAVFAALMVLTVATVAVSKLHMPFTAAVIVALLIATVKASLVAAFFMHLKGEKTLIFAVLGLTIVFLAVLFILPIADTHYLSGQLLHGEKPAGAPAGAEHH